MHKGSRIAVIKSNESRPLPEDQVSGRRSDRYNEIFKRAQIFCFDGEDLTVKQIHARVPALSLQTVRNHLKCGRLTTAAMLTFSTEAVRTANGKRAAKRYKARTS